MDVNSQIKELVEKSGLSIRQLSIQSSVRRQSLIHFLNGGNIHLKNLEKLLKFLGCEIELKKMVPKVKPCSPLEGRVSLKKKDIAKFCAKYGINYLAVFGSVLTGDFKDTSDIDVLVSFDKDISFFELMDVEEGLKKLFDTRHTIDLLIRKSISPLIKDSVEKGSEVLYAKAV